MNTVSPSRLLRFRRWNALVPLAAMLLALNCAAAGLMVGDALPDLSKFGLEGKLPELKGKVVLLDFWASWCAPCKESFPVMEALLKKFGDKGLVVVAVSVDEDKAEMDKFLKKTPAQFPIVRDAQQKLVAVADVATMPTSYLIDREGKVRFLHEGFDGEATAKEYEKQIEELLK